MTEQDDIQKKSRRDLLLVLLILPFGVLCMFMAGQAAIRLAPEWVLNTEMLSLLDPDAEFAARGNPFSIPPLNPNILTLPAWGDLFLTPNVAIPTRIILTATPPPVRTAPPVRFTPIDDPDPTATSPGGPIITPDPGERPEADLRIEKSDNSTTYTPGTAINYTILVTNSGPNPAPKFNVNDKMPVTIKVLSVNCKPVSLCGTNTSQGNNISFEGANLPASGVNQITISVKGWVSSRANGDLSNTASINIPSGSRFRDPNLKNNTVTDTDKQYSVYDLAITKNDGVDTFAANVPLNYTIVVTNSGPSDARGIRIRDDIPDQIGSWTWICRAVVKASGCDGISNSTSDFIDRVNIRAGGRIEYSVTAVPALLPQNPANLTNRVRILLPGGPNFIDPDPSNNEARDTNRPYVDLQITKTDVPLGNTYTPGGPLTYSIIVTNASTFNLTGVSVTDNLSPMFSTWTWTCAPSQGASCLVGPSNTNINDTAVSLPPSGTVTYTINATVHPNAVGNLDNTATVDPPAGLTDAVPGNNTATDSNTNSAVDEPDIGPPDGNPLNPPEGGPPIIMVFSPPIIADGDIGVPDFVYYELEDSTNLGYVALDWVQIDISTDGTGWIPVFNWGDGISDANSNVALDLISDLPCPNEEDNCPIPLGRLYNQTGITIDVDPLVPAGRYPWMRITAPVSPGADSPNIDAIQPYYP